MMKTKSPTIYNIFERLSDNKTYTKDALLKQDILSYYYRVIKELENAFRFHELGMWLLKNNLEFCSYYEGSHIKYRDRLDNRKYRIQNSIKHLIDLRLIHEAGTARARKVNTDVEIYEYTKGGQLIAWLIKGLDPKQRQDADAEAYNLIVEAFDRNEDTSSITISKFIRKCKHNRVFDQLAEFIRDDMHLDLGPEMKSVHSLFVYIFNSGFRGSQIRNKLVKLWFETIEELPPEIRKLMIYQTKLTAERRFEDNQISLTREYEQLRFELQGKYEEIPLGGECLNCKRQPNLAVHYSDYVKIISDNAMGARCPHCGLRESVIFSNF